MHSTSNTSTYAVFGLLLKLTIRTAGFLGPPSQGSEQPPLLTPKSYFSWNEFVALFFIIAFNFGILPVESFWASVSSYVKWGHWTPHLHLGVHPALKPGPFLIHGTLVITLPPLPMYHVLFISDKCIARAPQKLLSYCSMVFRACLKANQTAGTQEPSLIW